MTSSLFKLQFPKIADCQKISSDLQKAMNIKKLKAFDSERSRKAIESSTR